MNFGSSSRPVFKHPTGARASGEFAMALDQGVKHRISSGSVTRFEVDASLVAPRRGEVAFFVENVGDAAAHAGSEIPAAGAEHDHRAAGHVFAAVIADAFNDRCRAGVANGKRSPAMPLKNASPLVAP